MEIHAHTAHDLLPTLRMQILPEIRMRMPTVPFLDVLRLALHGPDRVIVHLRQAHRAADLLRGGEGRAVLGGGHEALLRLRLSGHVRKSDALVRTSMSMRGVETPSAKTDRRIP